MEKLQQLQKILLEAIAVIQEIPQYPGQPYLLSESMSRIAEGLALANDSVESLIALLEIINEVANDE